MKFQDQLKRIYKERPIKTAYFSIFRSGFRKILLQSHVELKYVSKIYGLNFEIVAVYHVSDFSHPDSISKL